MNASARLSAEAGSGRTKEVLTDWQAPGLSALAWGSPMWGRAMSDVSAEVMRFMNERIGEEISTQQEILQCRDPVELREIQGRFLKTAFDQYSAETGRLLRLNQAVLDELTGRSDGR